MPTLRTSRFSTNGALTYWDLGRESDPATLTSGLSKEKLPRYAPSARSWVMSLKTAVQELTSNRMVRPLASRTNNGYTIVEEVRGDDENEFLRDFNARVDDTGEVSLVHYEGDDNQFLTRLQERTNYFRRVLPADSVSKVLVRIVKDELGGLTIRENGGLYYIPEANLERWKRIATVIEQSGPGNHITTTAMEVNESTLLSIQSSIERDIESECNKIEAEIAANEFTERGINNRVQRASDLVDRIERYEGILDSALKTCRNNVVRALDALSIESAVDDALNTFADAY